MCMIVALITHTPEPVVWTYTIGMVYRRLVALKTVAPFINPFAAGGEDKKAISDPGQIRAFNRMIGLKPK